MTKTPTLPGTSEMAFDAERDVLGQRFDGQFCATVGSATCGGNLRPTGTRPASAMDAGNFWIASNPQFQTVGTGTVSSAAPAQVLSLARMWACTPPRQPPHAAGHFGWLPTGTRLHQRRQGAAQTPVPLSVLSFLANSPRKPATHSAQIRVLGT